MLITAHDDKGSHTASTTVGKTLTATPSGRTLSIHVICDCRSSRIIYISITDCCNIHTYVGSTSVGNVISLRLSHTTLENDEETST